MNIHFIGIGGIGISGLAQLCLTRGDSISGSNQGSNPIFEMLKNLGILKLYAFHDAKNIPDNTDLVVYTEAIPEDNVELQYAKGKKLPLKSYFEYLGEISSDYRTIAVAGTHGKTTTTGLIACGFMAADFDSTILVGSTLPEFEGRNFKIINPETFSADKTQKPWLLVEACEYRENFQFLEPEILIFTNVEFDHVDYFKDKEHYFQAFENLGNKAKTIIYHQEDDVSASIAKRTSAELFPIPVQSPNSVESLLRIFGNANVQNATLALGLAAYLNIKMEAFKQGLGHFKGAGRRQELIGTLNGVQVYDDYGHHPTEIRVTIEAFRQKFPKAKIGLIFEPHQYSRTRQFFDEFVSAVEQADFVGLYPIYEARDTDEDKASVSNKELVSAVSSAVAIKTKEDVLEFLKNLESGDILLFMGAGNISGFAKECLVRN